VGLAIGCLLAHAPTQEPAAANTENASPLYDLAIDAWRTVRANGVELPNERRTKVDRRALVAFQPRVVRPAGPRTFGAAWRAPIAATVAARDLLRRAAAGRVGTFDITRREDWERTSRDLHKLVDLVAADAWMRLEQEPATAITTATTLLRHARHLRAGGTTAMMTAATDLQDETAALLEAAIEHVDRERHATELATCAAELSRHLLPEPIEAFQQMLRVEIDPMLVIHHTRLRDMHQTLPAGYDEKAMRRAALSELEQVFADCHLAGKRSVEAWGKALAERNRDLRRAQDDAASITTKAARGVVQLILCSVEPALARRAQCQRRLLALHGALTGK